MPGAEKSSFRVLHPNPLGSTRALPRSAELHLSIDFPSSTPARLFLRQLSTLSGVRQPRFRSSPFKSVDWAMPLMRALTLPMQLKAFPVLSRQVEKGLKGYWRQGAWKVQGKGGKFFAWKNKTQIMGILNVTPDSFSDGGLFFDPDSAIERALQLQEEGADIIDVGGESTRPGAPEVSAAEEKKRVLPLIRSCAKKLRVPLSVDTYKAEVARAAVGEGARLINDIGALRLDASMGRTLAHLGVPVILMHMQGKPRTMQKNPRYRDVIGEILAFFRKRMDYAGRCGIPEEKLLLDPGFGFGKTPWHNIELTRRLWEFKVLGRPLVMGPSRKSTLGFLLGGVPPEERLEATAAAVAASVLAGADLVRVHDVKTMVRVVKIADAIRYNRGLNGS
jgi:dihydropteroate synthase